MRALLLASLLTLILSAALPCSGTAQLPTPVPGDYVRVYPADEHLTVDLGHVDGELLSLDGNGLMVQLDRPGTPRREWTWSQVELLQVNTGRERRMGRSVVKAMTWSGMVFGALVSGLCVGGSCNKSLEGQAEGFLVGAAFGAVVGVPFGLLFGARSHRVWTDAKLPTDGPAGPSFSVLPMGDGRFGLQARIPVGH